jgi:N-acetylmuramoyl-L-alanine amidase
MMRCFKEALKFLLFFVIFSAFGISLCYLSPEIFSKEAVAVSADAKEYTFILDAGHGGEDAGAIGVNGVLEKDINLSLTNILAETLKANGYNVILTRTEDKLLYTEEENIKGQRKIHDLKNRLKVAKENPDAIFISIHMNKFHDEGCRGMQIYYSKNTEESQRLAVNIQNMVKSTLQPYNKRQIKATDGTVYLLDNAVGTAILIECGFLSNTEECEKLSEKDYQTQLSFQIFCGIMEYIKN